MAAATDAESPPLLRSALEGAPGGVRLTLNRPAQFNALSEELIAALQQALDEIGADPDARVVVIDAAGRAFCAGHDLREMRAHEDRARHQALFDRCGRMMQTLGEIPQPVIASVQGVATAAGCQLVAACDLAVAATGARFATSGINLGLFCATPSVAISRALLPRHALELLLTGAFVDAETARALGLVNHVVAPEALSDRVAELAGSIAAKSPVAVRTGKQMFYRQLGLPLREAYAYASDVMAGNLQAEDAREGIDAFLEKREPRWRGR